MTALLSEDDRLMSALRACPELVQLNCRFQRGDAYGVMVFADDTALGQWTFLDGMYRFRTLSSVEPFCEAETLGDAIAITSVLAGNGLEPFNS